MSAPYWMHCNVCGEKYTSQLNLHILGCFHLVCRRCLQNLGKKNSNLNLISFKEFLSLEDFMVIFIDGSPFCSICKKKVNAGELSKVREDNQTHHSVLTLLLLKRFQMK
jgi:hypothetical protein